MRTTKALIRLRGCTGWSAPVLFAYGITGFLMTWLIYVYQRNLENLDTLNNGCNYSTIWTTVMFLSFWTDRPGQSIRVYTVCNSLCIFWMHYCKENPPCSTFRVITANFQVSKILGFLWYAVFNTVCYSVSIFLNHYCMVKLQFPKFRILTAIFRVSKFF